MELDNKLNQIFKETFELQIVDEELSSENLPSWDSVGHVTLVIALEEKFGLRIPPEDIITLTSFKTIKNYLREKV